MHRRLTTRVIVASGLLAALVGAIFALMMVAVGDMRAADSSAARAEHVIASTVRAEKLVVDLETGVRGFQITREPSFLQPWRSARRALPPVLRELERAGGRRTAAAIRRYVHGYTVPLVDALRHGQAPPGGEVAATAAGKRHVDAIRAGLARVDRVQRRAAAADRARAHASARRATLLAAAGLIGSALVIATFALDLLVFVAAPVRRVAEAARSLAAGDLDARVRVRGAGEVAELGRAFNSMGESLSASVSDLASHAEELDAQRDELEGALAEVRSGEERYRSLAHNMPNGCVFLFDRDLRYLVADGAGLETLGFTSGDIEGRTVAEVFAGELAAAVEAAYRDVLAGRRRRSEHEHAGRVFDVHMLPLRGPGGAVTGGMALLQDITDRVEAQAEMRRLAFEHASDLSAVADVIRQLPSTTDANRARLAICEAAREVCGAHVATLLEPDGHGRLLNTASAGSDLGGVHVDLGQTFAASVRAFSSGEPVFVAEMATDPAALEQTRRLTGSASALWQPVLHDGVPIGVLFIGWREPLPSLPDRVAAVARIFAAEASAAIERADFLAHLDELNRELAMQVEALRLSDRYKTDFVSSVSHELRTPLASILGYLEVLQEEELEDAERGEFLDIVAQNARRLLALINDLLTLAGLESGRVKLHADDADLRELVDTAVREQLPAMVEKRQQLIVDLPKQPVVSRVDRERVLQVLANLLGNAVKFTPQEGDLAVRLRGDGEEAVLEVADTGIGIADDEIERLFERFFRARSASASAIPGTGLGLAISQSIVDAHHGAIDVRSKLGEGTVFRVSLPQRTAV